MDIKITEKKEEPLLSRTEIIADITADITPKKQELKTKFASVLKVDEKLVAVKHIYTKFGSKKSKAIVYQYTNEEELKKIEPKEKEKKEVKEEKKEEKKEEPKPKKEKEEKKEEKKEEPKPKKEEKKD